MDNLPFVIWMIGWCYVGKTSDIDDVEFGMSMVINWGYRLGVWVYVGQLLYVP